ncbi:uncharacterized protein PAC_05756 [Phialocephala subalpina]|uniref:LSM domain-containing protein n=1 Tax=Phialocephala subalpina TaxID=576137 RepID=A0A1L7WSW5_9HELO|nr:uncharacterized protein PAC_05756 [Phialocephala subalpina]
MAEPIPNPEAKAQAESYLHSLLGKNLRITTTDTRMFLGQFKCTDSVRLPSPPLLYPTPLPLPMPLQLLFHVTNANDQKDQNIILSQTFEYRLPPPPKTPQEGTITQDLTSRYLGLIVVPGEYITKIEVEEFESQLTPAQKEKYLAAQRQEGSIGGEAA